MIPQITGYSYETIKVGFTKYLSRFRNMSFLVLTEDFTNPNILNQFVPNSKAVTQKLLVQILLRIYGLEMSLVYHYGV